MVAHNSLPIVFTNINDTRFDELAVNLSEEDGSSRSVSVPVVKLPKFPVTFSYPLQVILVERFSHALRSASEDKNTDMLYKTATGHANFEATNANLWK